MTTLVSIRKGHDVRYFTNAGGVGCAGAMAYYTRGGEPPGQWEGKAAARLGLTGQVDPGILDRLFMENIAPTGEVLAKRHQARTTSRQRRPPSGSSARSTSTYR